jgi:hypothetical protein
MAEIARLPPDPGEYAREVVHTVLRDISDALARTLTGTGRRVRHEASPGLIAYTA